MNVLIGILVLIFWLELRGPKFVLRCAMGWQLGLRAYSEAEKDAAGDDEKLISNVGELL